MQFYTTFGQWIKFRRKFLDLTQEQLARQVGCSPAAVKKIESDERRPSRQIAMLLAEQLRLSPEQCGLFVRVARGELPLERLPQPRVGLPVQEVQAAYPVAVPVTGPRVMCQRMPQPATALIGREHELAEITRLLEDPQCRLLTLTGTGGVGKTRLAIAAALKLEERFADGAGFVPLAGVDAPAAIIPAVACVLGTSFSGPNDARFQLFQYLQDKEVLLVLDNLEHLLESADLLGDLLQSAPGLKLLATSREQLHLQAEWVFEVRGLPVPLDVLPDGIDSLESSSAARLFVQRARQAQADFEVGPADSAAIGQICRLVQGLPLAIELAAKWTRTLSCQEIAQEIERGLEILAVNAPVVAPRDAATRHRSIRAVFDHSWQLLTAGEQQAIRRLSVFRGGFRREAAEQVAGAGLPVLSALIDKSLLWRSGPNHYDFHDLVRHYLAARLAENSAEEESTRRAHSQYYLTLLQAREVDLRSPRQKEALAELDVDIDNIRLAWQTAVDHEAVELICASSEPLYYFYELHQYFREAEALFHCAANRIQTRLGAQHDNLSNVEKARLEMVLACLLNYQAFFNLRPGNNREALAGFRSSLAILRAQDQAPQDSFPLAFALVHAGVVYWAMGEFDHAAESMEEGLSLSQSFEHLWLHAIALGLLGAVTHDRGDYPGAHRLLSEAVSICQAEGDPQLSMFMGVYYSRTLLALNRSEEARAFLAEGLPKVQATGNRWLTALGMDFLSRTARAAGHHAEALRLLEESIRLNREVGDQWSLAVALMELSRLWLEAPAMDGVVRESATFAAAEQHALEALTIMSNAGYVPTALEALSTLAEVCLRQDRRGEALALIEQILKHPATKQETRARAERLRAELNQAAAADEDGMNAAMFEQWMKDHFDVCLPAALLTPSAVVNE